MPVRVTCSGCQAKFRIADEYAGKKAKCPKCGAVFRVPAAAEPPPIPVVPPVSAGPTPDPVAPPVVMPVSAPQPVRAIVAQSPHPVEAAADSATAIASAAVTAVAIEADDEHVARYVARRRRRIEVPLWAWFAAGGVAVVLAVVAVYLANRPSAVAESAKKPVDPHAPVALNLNTAPFHPTVDRAAGTERPRAGAPLEDIVAYLKHGIVKIETSDGWNNRRGLGSGFVIDASGLVATNYHVVSDALKADVLFNDGTRYGVEGYTAVRPESDLAILKLNGVPAHVKALDLVTGEGPRDAAKVYAIGHPYDHEFTTTDGIVGRVLHTAQLPVDTQEWLSATLSDKVDNVWIQHSAKISPGNSGGPLINAEGAVVGINSWVNTDLGFGYALHARHLRELIPRQTAKVTLLRQQRRTLKEPSKTEFAGLRIAAESIKRLRDEWEAKSWRPRTDKDCDSLDELARAITAVKFVQDHPGLEIPMPAEEQAAVAREVDQVISALAAVHWLDHEHIAPINAHAGKEREPFGGAFLFGGVTKLFQGEDDEAGALVELKGAEKRYFVPLDPGQPPLKEGDCVLILAIAHPAKIRVGDNPLKPMQAQVLLSKVVLRVGP
ncbi:MAG: zinc-ribbon domain-containing protein [Planctomycetia bacterium]|nr:zinc-ribbon domain-containing protein [Planctomycetia bacterium]